MATIQKKFIGNNQVDGNKIRLDNNQSLKARNAANSADVNIVKVNTSDVIEMQGVLSMNSNKITNLATPTTSTDAATKGYIDGAFADQALSNLSSVAINTSLLPGTDNSINLGSAAKRFANSHITNNVVYGDTSGAITIKAADATTSYTVKMPSAQGGAGTILTNDGSGNLTWGSAGGSGTVTSVAMSVPSFLSVAGSPITTSGTLAVTLATQSANTVFAGPTSGGAVAPTFRSLVAADIPAISLTSGVSGVLPIANGGTNSSSALNNNRVMVSSSGAIVEAAAITASRALISDANGIPTHSSVTSTELGFVSGVTSAIQTQLDAKVGSIGTIDSQTKSANGAVISSSSLVMQTADASFPGLVSTGAQTFAGAKTFAGNILSNTNGTLDIGSSGNPFRDVFASNIKVQSGFVDVNGLGRWSQSITAPNGDSLDTGIQSSASKSIGFGTINAANTLAGKVEIYTGNSTTTGNSGPIILQTGTSTATRGDITLNSYDINLNAANQISANSKKIVSLADPSSAQDAATKAYVDNVAAGLKPKAAVRVATTAAGTLASSFENGDTIDGVVLSTGDRILIKNQSTSSENGIYTVNASGAPTRATDFDSVTPIDEINGAYTLVQFGTANAGTGWVVNSTVVTVGSSAITFAQFTAASTVTGGDMITVSGSTISVDLATTSGLESTNPGNDAGQLRVKLEASNPTLQIDGSNQLGSKLDSAGAIITGSSGIKVQVHSATQKIASNSLEGLKDISENLTLNGTDITNQYKDLSFAVYGTSASVNSVILSVVGGPIQQKVVDYTVSLTGGSGGVTRISFAGDLATGGAAELVSGDILMVSYSYLT